VHAAAPVLLRLGGRADVLDYGAVGDVLVGGLGGGVGGRGGGGFGAGFADEGLEDVLLVLCVSETVQEERGVSRACATAVWSTG
jgi:hypothetical protein